MANSSYYNSYINPAQAPSFQPAPGMFGVSTGINLQTPQLPQGAISGLSQYPSQAGFGGPFAKQGGFSPAAQGLLDGSYQNALHSANLQGANTLQNLFNQSNAANNMALGNVQSALTQRGALQGINQFLSQLGQGTQYRGDIMGFLQGILGKMLGGIGGMA